MNAKEPKQVQALLERLGIVSWLTLTLIMRLKDPSHSLEFLQACKIPHTVSISDFHPDSLMADLRTAHNESKTDVASGIAASVEYSTADIAFILPQGEKTHYIAYGGPPRSVTCWAVNLALDWLRRRAMESD